MHQPELVRLDQHYSPQFYAELWIFKEAGV
jgi:hypothetical protein